MDTTHSVLKSAKSFFAGTALSRVSGLLRDIVIAASFGSSPEIAAFMVSYRLANLFRRLLGEGNLQAGFVPHFASLKEEGGRFFRDVFFSMALILLVLVALLEAVLWSFRFWAGPDWLIIINLTMWMTPGLIFICLYGLNSSLLQCRRKYFIPAAAPVVFNLIWISAVFLNPDVTFLAIAITLAFAGQWVITAFEGAKLLPLREWLKPHLFSPEFKRLIRPLLLGIIGIGAVQFNSALDTVFARIADLKGPAFLWYAIRIQQLPLALFGIALSGALLPPLSRAEDPVKKQELLESALQSGSALMLIATFGIFALGESGINLLYGHGDFTRTDVVETHHCLCAYGLGLVPSVFVLILAAKYYAERNYRTPMIASLLSVGANIGLNALFVFGFNLGAVSIALATSISSFLNAGLLSKRVFTRPFWTFFSKIAISCTAALAAVFTVVLLWSPTLSRHFIHQVSHLALLGTLFLTVLGGCLALFRITNPLGKNETKSASETRPD